MSFKKIQIGFVCLFMQFCLPIYAQLTAVSVELKWFHQFQFAGIYAAKEKGFYRDEGLDVNILQRDVSSSPLEDVLSGKVQFGISDATIIRDRLKGNPVVILAAIFQHSPLVLLTLEKDKILSPIELRGKRIMYQENVDDAIIMGMFNEFGITKDELNLIPHNFKDDALLRGEADAMSGYLSNQPFYYKKNDIKINIIKPQNYGVDFYGDILFTSESYYHKHKQIALGFRRATLRGWEYAIVHPNEVIEWIQKYYNSKKSRAALQYEADVIKRMIANDTVKLGNVSKARLQHIAESYKKNEPSLKNGSITGLLYTDYEKSENEYKVIVIITTIIIAFCVILLITFIWISRKLKNKISERTQAIENSKIQLSEYIRLLDHNIMLIKINSEGNILEFSSKFIQTFGIDPNKYVNKNLIDTFSNLVLRADQVALINKSLTQKIPTTGECSIKNNDNLNHVLEFNILHMHNIITNLTESIIIFTDVTEKKVIESRSLTDALTQLKNRYALNKFLAKAINELTAESTPLTAIMLDIDYFKRINDQHGHNAGDVILKLIAKTLVESCGIKYIPGRWGGEEFLIICPQTTLKEAGKVAEELKLSIQGLHLSIPVNLTASFGVTQFHLNESIEQFIDRVDQALYQAKASGRNQVILKKD